MFFACSFVLVLRATVGLALVLVLALVLTLVLALALLIPCYRAFDRALSYCHRASMLSPEAATRDMTCFLSRVLVNTLRRCRRERSPRDTHRARLALHDLQHPIFALSLRWPLIA